MGSQGEGTLIVSVDLPHHRASQTNAANINPAERLIGLLGEVAIPATWAIDTPTAPIATSIRQADSKHELALAAPAAPTRRAIAQHLVRTRLAASNSGAPITTLAIGDECHLKHLDLFVKHGFSIVRSQPKAGHSVQPSRPQMIRYGVWQAPLSVTLRESDRRTPFGPTARTLKALKRAAQAGEVLHLGIDATAASKPSHSGWHGVRRLLDAAAGLREQRLLRCVTLQQVAADLQKRGQGSRPSRSVLRAA